MHGPSLSLPLMRVSLAVDPWLSGDADKDAAWDEAPSASLLRLFRPSALSVPPLQRSSGINDRARLAFVALLCLLLGAVAAISAMALLRLPSATERVPSAGIRTGLPESADPLPPLPVAEEGVLTDYVPVHRACVLARVRVSDMSYLPVFLGALHANARPPAVFLVLTEPSFTEADVLHLSTAAAAYSWLVGAAFARVVHVSHNESAEYFPALRNGAREYGYAYTDLAIARLLSAYPEHCRFLTVTSAANVYARGWMDRVEPHLAAGASVVGWDFVSRDQWLIPIDWQQGDTQHQDGGVDGVVDDGTFHAVHSALHANMVDVGAYMWDAAALFNRSSRADTFVGAAAAAGQRLYAADGSLLERLRLLTSRRIVLRQTLMLRQ